MIEEKSIDFQMMNSIIMIYCQYVSCVYTMYTCTILYNINLLFWQGLLKTAKSNFGGGNTKWEEKSLGKYRYR